MLKPRLVFLLCIVQVFLCICYFSTYGATTVKERFSSVWRASSTSPDHGKPSVNSSDEKTTAHIWPPSSKGSVGALVVAAREKSDIKWIEEVRPLNWEPSIYNVDAPYQGERTLTVIRNKGHEAMVYLTYIIDNYEALPPYAIFIHGNLGSWHQNDDILSVIRNIRLPAVDKVGYVSLRCDWYPSCPAELKLIHHNGTVWGPGVHKADTEYAISDGAWQAFFPNTPIPETIASQCCAQFVVTDKAMRLRTREDYIRIRQWILDTELIDDVSGRVLEKLWSYIMTGREVNCPSPHTCSCEFFGRCEKRQWPEPPPELGPLPEDSRWP